MLSPMAYKQNIPGPVMPFFSLCVEDCKGFPASSAAKNPPARAGDMALISGSGRALGEGNGNPLQYFCPENPMDGGAWWVTVHGLAKSRTRLGD